MLRAFLVLADARSSPVFVSLRIFLGLARTSVQRILADGVAVALYPEPDYCPDYGRRHHAFQRPNAPLSEVRGEASPKTFEANCTRIVSNNRQEGPVPQKCASSSLRTSLMQ